MPPTVRNHIHQNHVHGKHLSEELEYSDSAAYLHRKTHAYSSFTLSCGYVSVITFIYGFFGFVLTLQHRCTGVYPAVKFMGLACHCLAVFWFTGSLRLSGRCCFRWQERWDVDQDSKCVWLCCNVVRCPADRPTYTKKVACLISQKNTRPYTWDSLSLKPRMCKQW